MYLYLYDSFLNNKKFNNILAKIETRLTDLEIGGKISRLSPLKNITELIEDEIKNGIKTVIAVGNNKTLAQIINIVAKYNNITTGIIPIGPNNEIAQILGIPEAEGACDILSARRVEKIDLGKINNTYFLSSIKIPSGLVTLKCEDNYQITPQGENQINICNLRPVFLGATLDNIKSFDPQDGFLEILIQPALSFSRKILTLFKKKDFKNIKKSIFPFKKLDIVGRNSFPIITEGGRVLKTPAHVEIIPKKLKIIIGKARGF